MLERTQEEIMRKWKTHEPPLVSVSCITYNHELYIQEAIDSFLMQETDFPFEVLIHDDASTDNTATLIREYEKKYPDIIKPIYQTENQYSKGVRMISIKFNFTRAKGKYIALCEGDDYWTDASKLQLQVEYMENHPEVSLSFHNSKVKFAEKIRRTKNFCGKKMKPFFSTQDIILKSWFIPTQSILLRRTYLQSVPDSFDQIYNGDWAIQLICSTYGLIGYIDLTMSVYRKHETSLSNTVGKDWINRFDKVMLLLDVFNEYTNKKFNQEINARKNAILKIKKREKQRVELKKRKSFLLYIFFPKEILKVILLTFISYINKLSTRQ
ncbi:glycosyl transferase family 2 [Candidatus Thiomargarita nelsonii]|uniref:Glycosyl transferase family 2 n=1 Tax=Candidatus Thiomargarita nelsonii TaxID=1003181 RepID=A0A176RX92_9GAMM|nr:glycosyl transferase family 2 [Candidatus Thiomargarita nelsonii]